MQGKHLAYRPDIDGLRALAVLAVVIFHFNKEWLPGGFVGVDIFFVISGYLITGIIIRQVLSGNFLFSDFYIRRIRRIVPATLFVTLCTLIFGALFMLPEDVKSLSKSAIAATFSLANVYFWKFLDTSYFAASSDTIPLLHLWSLGVEEQFYLIWPALLLILFKIGGKKLLTFAALSIAAVCFWIGQHTLLSDPSFAYYMLPARAGELLVGAVTYWICEKNSGNSSRWVSNLLATLGTAGLTWSLWCIRENDGFPGFISVIPAIATALVIASGTFGKNFLASIISVRPIVAVGLVSFSLYLWHWPVLAFYRYAYGEPVTLGAIAICALAICMTTLFSYFQVEKRFRSGTSNKKAILTAIPASIGLAAVSTGLILANGDILNPIVEKNSSKVDLSSVNTKPALAYKFNCQLARFNKSTINDPRCLIGDLSAKPSMLIIGDSNAAHYVGFIRAVAENSKHSARNITHSACVPISNNNSKYVASAISKSCANYNSNILNYAKDYRTVFIAASWATYNKSDTFFADLEKQIATLSSLVPNVVVGLQAPRFEKYDRECAEKARKIPLLNCEASSRYSSSSDTEVNLKITQIVSKYPNVSTFTLRNYLCTNGICSAYFDGKPLYFDKGHLSMYGSYTLGKAYIQNPNKSAELTF